MVSSDKQVKESEGRREIKAQNYNLHEILSSMTIFNIMKIRSHLDKSGMPRTRHSHAYVHS